MTIDPIGERADQLITALRQMTVEQLRLLGTRQIIYLRTRMHDGELAFVLHDANGLPLVSVDDLPTAMEMAAQNGLCSAAVH